MTRTPSLYRAKTRDGRSIGFRPTNKDAVRLEHLARWYALSDWQIARWELANTSEDTRHYLHGTRIDSTLGSARRSVQQRFGKLARVMDNPGARTGPPVATGLSSDQRTVYYATPHALSLTEIPWRLRDAINPASASHAMMAADVGMQVESLGFPVLSEREMETGVMLNGQPVSTPIESHYTLPSGQQIGKKPDIAVLSADGRTFHAIEVERRRSRPMNVYLEKLRAYKDNPSLTGVWYLCASESIADRVRQAASRVFPDGDFNLRVRVVHPVETWHGLVGMEQDEKLINDLGRLK